MLNKRLRLYTYLGAIFMASYSSLPAYINSSFLREFFSEDRIGFIYGFGAIITIILMAIAPQLIRRLGNRRFLLLLTSLSIISLAPLASSGWGMPLNTLSIIIFFTAYTTLGYLTRYGLDIYLENISEDKTTGMIRGLYLTGYNLSWLVSPFLATYLLSKGHYGYVYALAGLLLTPFLLITYFKLQETKCLSCLDQEGHNLLRTLKTLWQNKTKRIDDLRHILVIDFLLNFFYSIMVIYMPIYLHNHLQISWQEIGLIFSFMLLPFVILELPLGKISDKWLGEKEVLIGGLIIIALSTVVCAIVNVPIWWLWAILLFLTRVGAASIEIMKETYLFKKIKEGETGVIALSRINVPLSYLIGPVFASLILSFGAIPHLFLALGLVMTLGLKFAWELEDTK